MKPDVLDWIRSRLAECQPAVLAMVEPVLAEARREWGGDTVYVRQCAAQVRYEGRTRIEVRKVTRRTLQNHKAKGN